MPSSNAWIESLGWMLIHSVWLIGVIVGMSAVGLGLLRHRSANARYLFGCVALLLSLSTLPAVLVWELTRSVTPDEFGTLVSTRSLTVRGGDDVDLDGSGETVRVDAGPELQGQPVQLEVRTLRNHDGRLLMDVDSPRPAEARATSPMELTAWQQAESRLRPHLALLVSGWLAGVVLLSVRPLIGWHSARRLQRVGLSEVSDSLQEMLSRLAGRLGLRRAVRMFQSSLVQIPCVVGALKPVILLPASAITGLSPEQLEALLAHELAHIRRHDFAVNVVQTLVETLLFYHPAIWWLSRRVRQEREHCCDDLAISVCGDVAGYARMLVSVEGLRGCVPQTSVAASGGSLVERIRRLEPSSHEQPRSPWLAGIIVLGTLVVALGSGVGSTIFRNSPEVDLPISQADDGEFRKIVDPTPDTPLPTSVVEEWQQALASDSAAQQAKAASEIAQRLTDKPAQEVDPKLIPSLTRLLNREEMATHGRYGRRVGDWCKESLIKIGQPAVAELIKVTSQGNAKARGRAAECLGAIKAVGPKGVEALVELLKHPDYEAHGPAASALKGLTAEPTLIPKLIEASEQGELKPRCWAVGVLGRLPDERGDAVLLKALDAPERDLRLWAAYAVSETPHPKLAPQIVSHTKTDDREIRQKLETALRITAKSNVPALVSGLKDDDARVRAACVFALAHLLPDQASRVVPALTAVLNDRDTNVRRNIFYLMQLNGRLFDADSFIGPLVKGLSDSDSNLRASAAAALQRFAEAWPTDRRPIEPLLKALDDSEPDVVVNAIRALAEFREHKVIARLTQLAQTGGQTGEAASQALGVLGDQGSRDILRQNLAKKQPGAIEALGKLRDRESIPQFIELLKDGDESVRTAAAAALTLNPDSRAIEPLIAGLKAGIAGQGYGLRNDRNNSTLAIADALGRIGDPQGIAALIEQLDEAMHFRDFIEDEAERSMTISPRRLDDRLSNHPFAWPLFRAGLPALPELAKGLASKSVATRKVCAWVLDNLAVQGSLEPADFESIRPALLTGLRDSDPVVRYCLVKTVGDLKLADAEPFLLELLASPLPKQSADPSSQSVKLRPIDLSPAVQIQVEVIRAFDLKTDRARDTLLRALPHSEPAVRSAAAGRLGAFPAAVTVEPLIKALSDPGACAEAARVLGHIGDPRAIAPLIELLKSNPNAIVQTNAAQALGLLGATDAKPALREVLNRIPVVDTKSEQFETQSAAAVSLVQLHDEAGTARLKELLGTSDYETRSNVAARLSNAKYFSEWRPSAALSHEPTRDVLRHFAEHAPDTPTRLQLFEALGGQLDQTTREFLERRARDPQEKVRWAAWRVLIRPNPAAYEEQLLELLDQHKNNDNESDYVRRDVVFFLGLVPTQRATDRLLALTSDANDEVRVAVVSALGKHRSPKVDARLKELSTNDPSLHVRARAVKVLAASANDSMHTGRVSGAIRVVGQVPVMLPTARWTAGGFHSELQRREWSITEQRRPTKVWDDSLLVSKKQGLANAVVYLRTAPKGFVPEPPPSEPFVLTNDAARFSPYVAVMRTGQAVLLKNVGSELVNFRSNPLRGQPVNMVVGQDDSATLKADTISERMPFSVVSDLQLWKRAFVLPLDHPFAAVTDSAGRFEISGLPPGEHDFIVWHERTGYLEKKLNVAVKEGETTKVPPLSYELAQFKPEQLMNGAAAWWADGGDGWSVGVGWSSVNTEFVFGKPDRSDAVTFQLSLRNNTDQPLTVPVPESLTWDFGMEDRHQLNVRIHDRGQTKLTLKPREVRVLDVPKPTLDLTDIEPGFWTVRFTTPFNRQGSLDLWLDAPQPRWLTRQVRVLRAVVKHPDDEFQNVLWGESLQGLRLGVRVKSNPADAVRIEPSPPPRSTFRLIWREHKTVKLVPEFFLWNATDADVAISMLHHTPHDWVHCLVQEAGAMRRTAPRGSPEVGPAPLVTGPKVDEQHRLKPGAVLRLGESALQVVPSDSKAKLDHQTAKLPADEYGYWSFLNLHRTDQPHVSLHLQSGLQRLLIEAAE